MPSSRLCQLFGFWMLTSTLAANPPAGAPRLVGFAYDLDSAELLYTEHHDFRFENGQLVGDSVLYRRPDGEIFAHKTLDFRPDLFVPGFHTRIPELGYEEGLRHEDGKLLLFRRKNGTARMQSKILETQGDSAADAGFHPYVQQNIARLLGGERLDFRFIAAGNLGAVTFKAQRIEDREFEGQPAVQFKVRVGSFIGLFVDPLYLVYDPDTRQLLEYRGLTNMRDAQGDAIAARIIYPTTAAAVEF